LGGKNKEGGSPPGVSGKEEKHLSLKKAVRHEKKSKRLNNTLRAQKGRLEKLERDEKEKEATLGAWEAQVAHGGERSRTEEGR